MIAHDSPGLDLANPKNWRTRSSIHVVIGDHHIQIDAGPEFRVQCLRNDISRVDTFILTHGHADHLLGMDDLRRFCDLLAGSALPVYSTEEGLGRIQAVFPYAMREKPAAPGYAAFRVSQMPEILEIPGGRIRSTLLPHGNVSTLGLIFEEDATGAKFAYFSDCKSVTPEATEMAKGAQAVALDGLRAKSHPSHMTIYEAIEAGILIGAPASYITHLTYQIDHDTWTRELPTGFHLAYDALRLDLPC